MSENTTARTYRGSCHCGAVAIEVELDLGQGTGKCNCTYCTKARHWGAVVKPEAFVLLSGEDALSDYQHGTKSIHFYFCRHCGIRPFAQGYLDVLGGDYYSINIACLDDIDPTELAEVPVNFFDGRNDAWMQTPKETRHL